MRRFPARLLRLLKPSYAGSQFKIGYVLNILHIYLSPHTHTHTHTHTHIYIHINFGS
ncbi:hypothetical protein HanPSC8_Chr16g0746091 [Helianthus annuus]|nr:hypothetical protein HanPSC8_Chr16g0746091 [Helianthus annuus]